MTKQGRTEGELRAALEGQVAALAKSIRAFEDGEDWEAPRIAVAVANLVYSSRCTKSIVDHLGDKARIKYISTDLLGPDGNHIAEHPLAGFMPVTVNGRYTERFQTYAARHGLVAMMQNAYIATFDEWWEGDHVYKSGGWIDPPRPDMLKATSLSRKDIIMTLRDQQGGAHYDDEIRLEEYARIERDGVGWALRGPDGTSRIVDGLLNAIAAQIGHELMTSLLTFYRDIDTSIGMPKKGG